MQVKVCSKCAKEKPITDYWCILDKRTSKTYTQTWCKECVTTSRKKRDALRNEKRKAARQMKEWANMHNPIPWQTLKGERKGETHKSYPTCLQCWRKYLPELGCIWCTRVYAGKA